MRGLSITGLVLGALGPLLMLAPVLLALLGTEGFLEAGWAFLFLTIPLGLILEIAGVVLVIVAASLALRRRYRPRSVPIVGLSLAGAGLLAQVLGIGGLISTGGNWAAATLLIGMALSLTGVIMCAVVGLRHTRRRWR